MTNLPEHQCPECLAAITMKREWPLSPRRSFFRAICDRCGWVGPKSMSSNVQYHHDEHCPFCNQATSGPAELREHLLEKCEGMPKFPPPAAQQMEETSYWLIEWIQQPEPNTFLHPEAEWLSLRVHDWEMESVRIEKWTKDTKEAIRFPSKEDAEAVIGWLWGTVTSIYQATEHMDMAASRPQPPADSELMEKMKKLARKWREQADALRDGNFDFNDGLSASRDECAADLEALLSEHEGKA